MKNKVLALMEIAIVLCSVFLVAIPAIAAEQNQEMQKVSVSASTITAASEHDYLLEIYGNANEDDTIDMRDLTYVKLIFFGKKPETELADAKYDGKVNPLDFIQIKLIIVGKEKELTIIDSCENIVTFKLPIERIAVSHLPHYVVALGAFDRVVGVASYMHTDDVLIEIYPDITEIPDFGRTPSFDCEVLLALEPDIAIVWNRAEVDKIRALGIPTFEINTEEFNAARFRTHREVVLTLGYLLGKEDRAREVISYMNEISSLVEERVSTIPEDKKRTAIMLYCINPPMVMGYPKRPVSELELAGIIDIAVEKISAPHPTVDIETIIVWDPDIIYIWYWSCSSEEIYGSEEWQGVRAVREKKVFKDYYITRWSPCFAMLVLDRAMKAYPELFEDIDFDKTYEEFTENVYWVRLAPIPGANVIRD